MEPKQMGLFIRSLRKEKALTQEQLAEALYVSGKTVSRWETGNTLPDLMMLQNIADFFEVDIRELIDGRRFPEDRQSGELSEERETIQKMTEYSSSKEKRISRRMWLVFGMIVIGALAAAAVITLKKKNEALDREQQREIVGEAVHYTRLEKDGKESTEIYLIGTDGRAYRILVTADTEMDPLVQKSIETQDKGFIMRADLAFTERERKAAEKDGGQYVYPVKAVEAMITNYLTEAFWPEYIPGTDPDWTLDPSESKPPAEAKESRKPLQELREGYTAAQAERDGCIVMDGIELLHGEQRWLEFLEQTREGTPCLIRIYQGYTESGGQSVYFLRELEYTGEKYTLSFYDKSGDTGEWFFSQESYRYLLEEQNGRYEIKMRNYLLADHPEAGYQEYTSRLLSSSWPVPDPEGKYTHCTVLLSWDISDNPELETSMYGVEMADIDGDGRMEKCFLGRGRTSGVFTFTLTVYKWEGGLLSHRGYRTPFMELGFIRDETGNLCVQGVESQTAGKPEHLYRIVIRDGQADLEENGQYLEAY